MHLSGYSTEPIQQYNSYAGASAYLNLTLTSLLEYKYRAVKVLSRLSATGEKGNLLKDALPLLALDHVVNTKSPDTPEATIDNLRYSQPTTLFDAIRVPRNDVLCHPGAF